MDPYEYDNVSIRYYANNSGRGYAYGGEVRLFGDLVKGTPSWVSVGVLNGQSISESYNWTIWSDDAQTD